MRLLAIHTTEERTAYSTRETFLRETTSDDRGLTSQQVFPTNGTDKDNPALDLHASRGCEG